jgi:pyridoxal phosphate enzyme (YggS family)
MAPALAAPDPERVRANVSAARQQIAAACARSGRQPSEVELLAATKYLPAAELGVLAQAGIDLVGENVAADLIVKHGLFKDRLIFDFIGHLQSRKTKDVLPRVRLIHSVESESVLRQLERHAPGSVTVLMEVNLSREHTKFGVEPHDVDAFLESAARYPKVRFGGLMTMPPLTADPEEARPYFSALRELAVRLRLSWAPDHPFEALSMGTSQDFEVAVEEGATVVRLGALLYA